MLTYPQLVSGAAAQYPTVKRRFWRTVVNAAPDGRTVRLADPAGNLTEWDLAYSGLTDDEAAALESFFRATEGRLRTFTFLDPVDNLLAWSDKPDEAVWQAGPSLAFDMQGEDPYGGSRGFRIHNAGGAAESLSQTLDAPGDRVYCFSVYARSATATPMVLWRDGERRVFTVETEWRRFTLAGAGAGAETVSFGIELGPGTSLDVFGMQAEAQIGASGYRRTRSRGGVYADARFRDDVLRITTEGANQHSCLVHIEHANHI